MRELLQLIFNKRFRQIFSLFVVFVAQFWWLGKTKRFLPRAEVDKRYRELYRKQARKFTDTAIDLGGLLIKLGQFFSSRVDILPQEYTAELAELQDAVKPVETGIIRRRIEQELSAPIDHVFSRFSDEPLAAASLGQVHRAQLPDGDEVAVKVLRPGIEDVVAVDLEALKLIMAFAKRYRRISNSVDLDQVYLEFRETVAEELDYVKEAKNAEKIKQMFADDERMYVPRIYWPHTTRKVLTMEFVEGLKINDFKSLDRLGLDRKAIADTLLSSYLQQVMVEGFFHADPHPGNILVENDGTLVLLDFGMVGRVDKKMKEDLIDLAVGVFKKDAGAIVEAFDELDFLRPQADRSTVLKSVRLMLANLFGESADIGKLDFNELSIELREMVYSQPFQLPARTTFLGKALITVFGLCNGLDKDFNLMEAVGPYIGEMFVPEGEVPGVNMVYDQVKKTLLDVVVMPQKVNRFIDGIESGEVRLHPAKGFEQRLFELQSVLANRIVFAVLASGFVISGAQLLDKFYGLGIALLSAGGGFALLLLRGGRTGKRGLRMMNNMGSGFKKPRFHP